MKSASRFVKVREQYVEHGPDGLYIYRQWVEMEVSSTETTPEELAAVSWLLLDTPVSESALSPMFCIACTGTTTDFLKLSKIPVSDDLLDDYRVALEYMVVRLNVADGEIPDEPRIRAQNCPICQVRVRPDERYPKYVCQTCLAEGVEVDGKLYENDYLHDIGHYPTDCRVKGYPCEMREHHFGGMVVQKVDN